MIIPQNQSLSAELQNQSILTNNSIILQLDGNQTLLDSDTSDSTINSDHEVDSEPIPTQFHQLNDSNLEVNVNESNNISRLPLCLVLNARSLYNKVNNFRELITQIAPDIVLVSETWERKKPALKDILSLQHFEVSSFKRNNRAGGGCAILYNKHR